MLKVNNLNVFYGQIHAIKDASFEVRQGEVVALIGANGAGKSTILKTVSGILRSRGGSVTFLDQDISHVEPHDIVRRGLAQVPEGRRIFLQMTVMENLEMGAFTRGTLSGGEQQMLAMGRALMSHPKLLMLDEPSMGLAPILVDQIFGIIKELNAIGTTILLVEQNAGKALEIAHRAYVLETGKIVLTGTGEELSQSDEIRKAYLGG